MNESTYELTKERLRYYPCSENRQFNEQLKDDNKSAHASVIYITCFRMSNCIYVLRGPIVYYLSCGCLAIPLNR